MVAENKCCSDVRNKHFNNKSVMPKEADEDFENLTNVGSDNAYLDSDTK